MLNSISPNFQAKPSTKTLPPRTGEKLTEVVSEFIGKETPLNLSLIDLSAMTFPKLQTSEYPQMKKTVATEAASLYKVTSQKLAEQKAERFLKK